MQQLYNIHDMEFLIMKILCKEKKLFDKSNLYFELEKYYKTNSDELSMCNFLFQWERLTINTNFIMFKNINQIEYIGVIENSNDLTEYTEPNYVFNVQIEIKETIEHFCNYQFGYYKTKLLAVFFKKYFPTYSSIYELLILNKNTIGNDNLKTFINVYLDFFDSDEIISLFVEKKSNIKSNQLIKYSKPNYTYGFGLFGIVSLFIYTSPFLLEYLKIKLKI